ncbi:MAG: NYN domain-containing protein, partial [Chloroflexi bacterium]|nr:NYN domain-containing protein [Chloroflexota bacterium]
RVSEMLKAHEVFEVLWLVFCQRAPIDEKVVSFLRERLAMDIENLLDAMEPDADELGEDGDEPSMSKAELLAQLGRLEDKNENLKEELVTAKKERARLKKKLAEAERATEKTKAESAKSASALERQRRDLEKLAERIQEEKVALAEERVSVSGLAEEAERTKGGFASRLAELEKDRQAGERARVGAEKLVSQYRKERDGLRAELEQTRREYQELALSAHGRLAARGGEATVADLSDWSFGSPGFMRLLRSVVERELKALADASAVGVDDLGGRLGDLGEFLRLASRASGASQVESLPADDDGFAAVLDSAKSMEPGLPFHPEFFVDLAVAGRTLEKMRLLRLKKILVDGNNLVLRTRQEADFSADRRRVLDLLELLAESEDVDITAVFDSDLTSESYSRGRVKLVFTGFGEPDADHRIEEELAYEAGPQVLVVSSDFNHVRPMAEATGASFMPSEEFRSLIEAVGASATAAEARL